VFKKAKELGFKGWNNMSVKISGKDYAGMYGPTKGDRVRLADTDLIIEIEEDYTFMEMSANSEEVIHKGRNGPVSFGCKR